MVSDTNANGHNWQVINFLIFNLLLSKWKAIIIRETYADHIKWERTVAVLSISDTICVHARHILTIECVNIIIVFNGVCVLCQSKKIYHSINSNKSYQSALFVPHIAVWREMICDLATLDIRAHIFYTRMHMRGLH